MSKIITTRLELADSILAARVEEDMTAEQGAAAQVLADAVLAGATGEQLEAIEGLDSVNHLLVYAQMCMVTNEWVAREKAAKNSNPEPRIEPELVRCRCGHTVSKILVMSTSRGSSCPDCYDRMSI